MLNHIYQQKNMESALCILYEIDRSFHAFVNWRGNGTFYPIEDSNAKFGPRNWRLNEFPMNRMVWHFFLDASSHLYKRVCPSVGPSVRMSRFRRNAKMEDFKSM